MALETRHTEKTILYRLLLCQKGLDTLDNVITGLMATMEQDDVQVVEKRVEEFVQRNSKKPL
jgi:hypothetical protein